MGGLGATFEELDQELKPLPNLYLDTSNASHTLSAEQFIRMLHTHGPGHILFGTDWPWFLHISEVKRIDGLMEKAGFSKKEKEAYFYLVNFMFFSKYMGSPCIVLIAGLGRSN